MLTSRLLCILCTGDHHLCPAVLSPFASLPSREISGPELDTDRTTTLHHLCLSKMPSQQMHTGRLLFICLVLPFLGKTQLRE